MIQHMYKKENSLLSKIHLPFWNLLSSFIHIFTVKSSLRLSGYQISSAVLMTNWIGGPVQKSGK